MSPRGRTTLAGRRDTFRRQARARFDSGERELQPVVMDALGQYLAILRRRAAHAPALTAAAAPRKPARTAAEIEATNAADDALFSEADAADLLDTLDQKGLWGEILDRTIMPALKRQLVPILQAGMSRPDTEAPLTTWRNDWLAERRQELVNVPDAITDQLRTELQGAAAAKGTSVDDARSLVDTMLDDGYPSWEGRAQLIARTETVGANNQGSLAAMSAVADADNLAGTKTWLATSDEKTRPDHAEIDGTTIGLSETFAVGDVEMNGPGDNAGGASQVCNCRCTLTYAFAPADTADDPSSTDGDNPVDNSPDEADSPDLTAAADTAAPTGVAVMAKLSPEDSARAAVVDGETPDALHVTLGYLAKPAADYSPEEQAAIVSAVGDAVASLVPFPADAFATAHFNPEDDEREPCAVVLVQSDELAAAHDAVATALGDNASTTFPIYIPHVTIAYNADPTVIPTGVAGSTFTFDRVVVGWAGAEIPVGVDSSADTGVDSMTAATEAPVTAPTDTAPPAPTAPGATAPGATGGDTATDTVPDAALEPTGITWSGPVAILNTSSSDGRVLSPNVIVRPLPQSLSWQRESQPEHWTSVEVGRVLAVEVRGDQLWATGDWLDPNINYDVMGAMEKVDAGIGFVSVDAAVHSIGYRDAATGQPIDPSLYDGAGDVLEEAVEWEFGGVTLISFAAFADARIANEIPADDVEPVTIAPMEVPGMTQSFAGATPQQATIADDGLSINLPDGSSAAVGDPVAWSAADGEVEVGTLTAINSDAGTVDVTPTPDADDGPDPVTTTVDVATLVAVPADAGKAGMEGEAALLASSEVRPYTAKFFAQRELNGPTPLTVDTATGEVFGHLATWGECHMGKIMEGKCVTAPPAPNGDYSYFHLSDIQTDDGLMSVGKITLGAGHAGRGGMRYALAHYDNSAAAVAVVRAFEDDYGIQVAGQIIHDTPTARVEELMRSPLSGDWRGVNGELRLTAALAVNTPGFPVRRPVVGMSGDRQISLVAAGVVEIPDEEPQGIRLPSGVYVPRSDFEVLTAAAIEAVERKGLDASDDEVALARARFTLLHGGRAAS